MVEGNYVSVNSTGSKASFDKSLERSKSPRPPLMVKSG